MNSSYATKFFYQYGVKNKIELNVNNLNMFCATLEYKSK